MANSLPSFDQEFQPQITTTLNTVVEHMQKKTAEAQSLDVDEAEKLLDDACNDCIKTFQSKMEDIKASAKRVKPDPSSPTYNEDNKKYKTYIVTVANSIEKTKSLFDTVFASLRQIVSTVVEWIKAGVSWAWNQLTETFTAIKSLWNS